MPPDTLLHPQGHIGLDRAVWPEGTPGAALDALARVPLWADGLNYRHGTGHGVGAALNVHEGPQVRGRDGERGVLPQPVLLCKVCSLDTTSRPMLLRTELSAW